MGQLAPISSVPVILARHDSMSLIVGTGDEPSNGGAQGLPSIAAFKSSMQALALAALKITRPSSMAFFSAESSLFMARRRCLQALGVAVSMTFIHLSIGDLHDE